MIPYIHDAEAARRRALALAAIVVLHALVIYGLSVAGLAVRPLPALLEVRVIRAVRPAPPLPPLPPLPPVLLVDSRSVLIEPPRIVIPAAEEPLPDDLSPPMLHTTMTVPADPPPRVELGPTTKPRVIFAPSGWDRYPAESIRAKESGTPSIQICLTASGAIESVEIVKGSGFPRLDQAALGVGRDSKFRPATRAGMPVAACATYRITFRIS